MFWIQRGSLQPYLFSCSPGGNAQSFLGLSSGRRRASHGSVFHFRAPGQDVSFPDGITDDGVFHGDHEGHRGSLLLSRGAGQAGPLPKSPLLRSPKPGPGHGEEGPLTLPTGELAAGGPEGLVSSCAHHTLDCLPREAICQKVSPMEGSLTIFVPCLHPTLLLQAGQVRPRKGTGIVCGEDVVRHLCRHAGGWFSI